MNRKASVAVAMVLTLASLCFNASADPRVDWVAACTCGDMRWYTGETRPDSASGEGLLSFEAMTLDAPSIRDPRGRWMRFDRGQGRWAGDVPGASSYHPFSMRFPGERVQLDIPGPVTGDYLIEWLVVTDDFQQLEITGRRLSNRERSISVGWSRALAKGLHRWRLHYQLDRDPAVTLDTLAANDSVAVLPPWAPVTLRCMPDWNAMKPAVDVLVAATGRHHIGFTCTPPTGQSFTWYSRNMADEGPHWVRSVPRSANTRGEYIPGGLALHLDGAERGPYQCGITSDVGDTVTIRVMGMQPDGQVASYADSIPVRAGESCYWHFDAEDGWAGPDRLMRFGRGPRVFPLVEHSTSEIIEIGAEPALSADGRMLAFVRDDALWCKDLASGRCTLLARAREPHWPAWSPDGRSLLFQARTDEREWARWGIWKVESGGSGLQRLSSAADSVDEQYPLWSPHGDAFVYTRGEQLWLSDAARTRAHALTRTPAAVFERACEWAKPEGPILYVANNGPTGGPQYEVREVNPNGEGCRATTPSALAEDARRIGPHQILGLRGHELFVAAGRGGDGGADWFLDAVYLRRFHSRVALAADHRTAYIDSDPWPNGDPLIVRVPLPDAPDPLLVTRYREVVTWIGRDSISVEKGMGSPRLRGSTNDKRRFWWYGAGARGGRSVGDLQLEFDGAGRLGTVVRVPTARDSARARSHDTIRR